MKLMKRIAVGLATLLLLTSCSILQKAASATSLGGNTGTAISAIYNVLKAAGGIDLSNLTNIINIGKILTGAGSLSNGTQQVPQNDTNVNTTIKALTSLLGAL